MAPTEVRMPERVLRRMGKVAPLTEDDRRAIAGVLAAGRAIPPGTDLATEGDPDAATHVILSGWACQYKELHDGRRQIVGLLVPGDIADVCCGFLPTCDHSLATLTHGRVARVPHGAMRRLAAGSPGIGEALANLWLASNAIQQEWIVGLGARSAPERLGHLLCEIYARLEAVGLANDGSCEMPLRQRDIADALGMSVMHVNRTLHAMRSAGLMILSNRRLTIPDLAALRKASAFDGSYLWPQRDPGRARIPGPWPPLPASAAGGRDATGRAVGGCLPVVA